MADSIDYADEDFAWPEVNQLKVGEAIALLGNIELQAAAANKRAKTLASRKATAKAVVDAVLEEAELTSGRAVLSNGREVQYTKGEETYYSIIDPIAFAKWAKDQNESFYDREPRLRDDIFRDEMRRRTMDGEPLPPGVQKYTDTKLSKSTVARKR